MNESIGSPGTGSGVATGAGAPTAAATRRDKEVKKERGAMMRMVSKGG